MSGINMDVVLEAYTSSREAIKNLENEIAEIKVLQTKREEWLLGELIKQGAQNIQTKHGITVYRLRKESVTVGDGEVFMNWVRETEKWEFLNKAANKTAVLEAMGEDRTEPPPPGVNYVATAAVGIRKS